MAAVAQHHVRPRADWWLHGEMPSADSRGFLSSIRGPLTPRFRLAQLPCWCVQTPRGCLPDGSSGRLPSVPLSPNAKELEFAVYLPIFSPRVELTIESKGWLHGCLLFVL